MQSPLSTFVSFPSPYTQTLLVQALISTLPNINLSLVPFPEDSPPSLQWADYDLLSFKLPHANPTQYLISSYIYRKALIRKHQLHLTIIEYLAKCRHRGVESILAHGGWPIGWNVELQFADELDEMWVDELYDLGEVLKENETLGEEQKRWYILKPGFADRAQGIRLFSTQDELQEIFETFESPSSDEEDDAGPSNQVEAYRRFKQSAETALKAMRESTGRIALDSDSDDDDAQHNPQVQEGDEEEEEEEGTGVKTSQLRHFVIQEYVPRPVLFDITQQAHDPDYAITGYKFHLRAYVLLTGAYTVHVSRTMLALFSGSPYINPVSSDGDIDLRPHLTNTCLQTDAYGAPSPPEELVKLFWELDGLNVLQATKQGYGCVGTVDKLWLEGTFAKVGEVVAESVKAGIECGSFGLQLLPNAFEVFGVDLLLSLPEGVSPAQNGGPVLPIPLVTLLEYNASPDFHQSGNRLRMDLLDMFRGVVNISIKPFFGLKEDTEEEDADNADNAQDEKEAKEDAKGEWSVGKERWDWRLVGKGEIRGPSR